jgi:hypothetical protein
VVPLEADTDHALKFAFPSHLAAWPPTEFNLWPPLESGPGQNSSSTGSNVATCGSNASMSSIEKY